MRENKKKCIFSTGKRSSASAEPNSPGLDDRQPEGILRRNSDCITPQGSSRDLRRGSDVSNNEMKTRSQFANKLRRNSDFGNRTPKRAQPEESKLAKILDISPSGECFFFFIFMSRCFFFLLF